MASRNKNVLLGQNLLVWENVRGTLTQHWQQKQPFSSNTIETIAWPEARAAMQCLSFGHKWFWVKSSAGFWQRPVWNTNMENKTTPNAQDVIWVPKIMFTFFDARRHHPTQDRHITWYNYGQPLTKNEHLPQYQKWAWWMLKHGRQVFIQLSQCPGRQAYSKPRYPRLELAGPILCLDNGTLIGTTPSKITLIIKDPDEAQSDGWLQSSTNFRWSREICGIIGITYYMEQQAMQALNQRIHNEKAKGTTDMHPDDHHLIYTDLSSLLQLDSDSKQK